jgi:hypothetical protein
MQKLLFSCGIVAAGAVALAMITSANAFVPSGNQIGKATSELGNTIEVKRSTTKSRPPGWDNPKGKKKGWKRKPGVKTLPPGQR